MKSKVRQQSVPTQNIIKSEIAYPVCFAVFSGLFSASKRRFEQFISQRLVHVHHCIMLMKGWKLEVQFECNLTRHLRRALRKPQMTGQITFKLDFKFPTFP